MGWLTRARKALRRWFHGRGGGGGIFSGLAPNTGTPGTLTFSTPFGFQVVEGQGFAQVAVQRKGGSVGAVAVNYASFQGGGNAVPGVDYTEVAGTLNWDAGDQVDKIIRVPITDNFGQDVSTRTFHVKLVAGSATNGAKIGTTFPESADIVVTIFDDDFDQVGIAVFRPRYLVYSVLETATALVVKVERGGSLQGAVTVDYHTVDGSATQPTYYTNTTGTLSWNDGEAGAKNITIPIVDNATADGDKVFTLVLNNPTGQALVDVGYGTVTITIIDDESVPGGSAGEIRVVAAAVSVSEGVGTATIFVERVAGKLGTASVDYHTEDGTGIDGTHYDGVADTLSWANGEFGPKSIDIDITNDLFPFGDKNFSLVLDNVLGATLGTDTTLVSILDDDKFVDIIDENILVNMVDEEQAESEEDVNVVAGDILMRPVGLALDGESGPSKGTYSNNHANDLYYSGQRLTQTPGGRFQLVEEL